LGTQYDSTHWSLKKKKTHFNLETPPEKTIAAKKFHGWSTPKTGGNTSIKEPTGGPAQGNKKKKSC